MLRQSLFGGSAGMKIVSMVVTVAFLASLVSCTHGVNVSPGPKVKRNEKILSVVLPSGEEIFFDKVGGWIDPVTERVAGIRSEAKPHWSTDPLGQRPRRQPEAPVETPGGESAPGEGRSAAAELGAPGTLVSFPLSDVLYLRVQRFDPAATAVLIVGVTALAIIGTVLLIEALKESCPFVYSFDGSQYVLDAEPLGGAICHGLRRTDDCRLDFLAPDDGAYRLMIRNEVHERQHLDRLSLLVFDHSPDVEIVADFGGRFHAISSAIAPASVTDGEGRDIRPFFLATDGLAWTSHMPLDESQKPAELRHEITLSFPKPAHAASAKLVINAGATLWASNMIREMVAMTGEKAGEWYQRMEADIPARMGLKNFLVKEELYYLRIEAATESGWKDKAVIRSGGPLVIEDQAVALDLSDVAGDSLTLRVRPPFGFWSIDQMTVVYDGDASVPEGIEVQVTGAIDDRQGNVTERLLAIDDSFYDMPRLGDRAEVTFAVPDLQPGLERTVFLRTSGFYEIEVPSGPDQRERLLAMTSRPGGCVEFAVEKYLEWVGEMRAEEGERR